LLSTLRMFFSTVPFTTALFELLPPFIHVTSRNLISFTFYAFFSASTQVGSLPLSSGHAGPPSISSQFCDTDDILPFISFWFDPSFGLSPSFVVSVLSGHFFRPPDLFISPGRPSVSTPRPPFARKPNVNRVLAGWSASRRHQGQSTFLPSIFITLVVVF